MKYTFNMPNKIGFSGTTIMPKKNIELLIKI